MAQEVELRDFGVEDAPIPFLIKGEKFYIVGDLPLTLVNNIAKWQESGVASAIKEHGLNMILDLFAEFMLEESYVRFARNVAAKKVGLRTILELLPWILEQYGLRPTQPSSPSSDGSGDGETGINLMDGASPEELIPSSSVPIDS